MKATYLLLLIVSLPVISMGQKRLDAFYKWYPSNFSDSVSYEYDNASSSVLNDAESVKGYIHENGLSQNYQMSVPKCGFTSAQYFSTNPGGMQFTLERTYDANQQVVFEQAAKNDGTTDQWYYTMDEYGNVAHIKYVASSHADSSHAVFQYNGTGQTTVAERYVYVASDERLIEIDSFQYDASGNQIYETHYKRLNATGHTDINGTLKHVAYKQSAYDNSGIVYMDEYAAVVPGGTVEYIGRTKYFNSNNHMDSSWFYNTHNGILSDVPYMIVRNNYDNNSNLLNRRVFMADPEELVMISNYQYDADGYLVKEMEYSSIGQDNMNLQQVKRYHYSSVAGISEEQMIELSVYPNPAADQISIATTATIETLTVTDMTGNTVLTRSGNAGLVSVQHLPAGVYFVAIITTEGKAGFRQFIKR